MALFGSSRDASLFRNINRELLQRVVDTQVLFYKVNLDSTSTNLYDETDKKVYNAPILIHSLISLEEQQWNSDDYGSDVTQTANFAFLRDDLIDLLTTKPEVGDVIEYTSRFFEIDAIIENQAFMGKNPDNWFGGSSHGYNISIICQAHMTRQSKVNVVQARFGNSVSSKDVILPSNL